jgi:hypothetical protein
LDFAQVAQLSALVKRARRRGGDLDAGGARGSEAAADVEVVDGRERIIDGRRAALQHGMEVGAVVAHCPVAAVGAGERILVEAGAGKPGQELADLGGVGPARLVRQRGGLGGPRRSPRGPRRSAPAGRAAPGRVGARRAPSCSL